MHRSFKKRYESFPIVLLMNDIVHSQHESPRACEKICGFLQKMYDREDNLFISTPTACVDIVEPFIRVMNTVEPNSVVVFGAGTLALSVRLEKNGFRNVYDIHNYQAPADLNGGFDKYFSGVTTTYKESFASLFEENGKLPLKYMNEITTFIIYQADCVSNVFFDYILRIAEKNHIQVIAIGGTKKLNPNFEKSSFAKRYYKGTEALEDARQILNEHGFQNLTLGRIKNTEVVWCHSVDEIGKTPFVPIFKE